MEFYVNDKLDQTEHENILNFLSSLDFYCIEQHPDWDSEYQGVPKKFFFCTDENQAVKCYANIIVSRNGPFKLAFINFGPAFADYEVLTSALQFLHGYFSKEGYIYFTIQLGIYISEKTELLEYTINKYFKVKYYFKPGNLWSSLCVDLTRSETDIYESFSRGHRKNIKAGYKKDLKMAIHKDNSGFKDFIALYTRMLEFRNLPYNKQAVIYEFNNIFDIMSKYNKGFIGYIYEKEILVGTLIIIFQGNSARYIKSASDPERRDLEITYMGLNEAIKYCKENGFQSLDLWGYNHFVDEKDQVFYINKFKKGFTDIFTFFPKRMHFELKPFVYKVFLILKFIKNGISKIQLKRDISKAKNQ
jgi:hypothetical protein